jgi:hypothetical protein
MYGYELEMEHRVYRDAPPLCNPHYNSGSSEECEVAKNKKGEEAVVQRNWLTVVEASKRAAVSENTIKNWVNSYGIGIKVGGRYRVITEKLDEVLRGEAVKR